MFRTLVVSLNPYTWKLCYHVLQINQVIMNIQLLSGSTEPERLGRNRGQAALNS